MVPVLLALVALALVAVVALVATGRLRVDPLADAVTTTPDHGLPPEPAAADVRSVRFDTAARGYRMDEVDAHLLDLADTLAARERDVAELRGDAAAPAPADPTDPTSRET
ncbi:DivIVA domain-containing protein [Phycicoccus jejuensis]|uniref:DivIVA domain-containing protein n=1 Tax=Phycicoccus jejuensis TaxID=367299 RepID=UPI00068EE990|nr:DivIVA domain-containing protein [Phycicoccus jejuensis]